MQMICNQIQNMTLLFDIMLMCLLYK
uniref:Uncharacterized protein n=1 Tax=Anguilla anguilla TaxID=7936 RepID=A0A0E9W638_ANGAN